MAEELESQAEEAAQEAAASVENAAEEVAQEVTTETTEVVEEVAQAEEVVEAAEAVVETVEAAPAEAVAEEVPVAPVVEAPKKAAAPTGKIGYFGEIEGKVYRLDEINAQTEAEIRAADFEALLNSYDSVEKQDLQENEIVKGHVVSITDRDVVVDLGFKSDGIVPRSDFDGELAIGDEIEVYIERVENKSGQMEISRRRAVEMQRWNRILSAHQNDEIVEGLVVKRIKGGMIVDLFGKEAFLPGSQIDVRPVRDFDAYLNKKMEFKVVKINTTNGNVVVSHKALIEKDLEAQRVGILEKMEPGQVLEGTVKNITDFGVFIDLGGVDGLLHITDLSWGRVNHPAEVLSLDQKVQVVVLDYDQVRHRISLGMKQLQQHPWDAVVGKYQEGTNATGKVVSVTDYGAFIELEKGVEGLVHISEMSWTQHVKHPTQIMKMGDEVEVKILNIDTDNRKISLGMKQLTEDPWGVIEERYPAGTRTKGIVRNLTQFGVFVEVEAGVDGLVHVSDLSWTKKVRHPGEIVKKDQELEVIVLDIDKENRRLSLGHKQVETNPWNQFANAYAEGTDTTGKVLRFNENGIVVELPLEVEGFIPASHLVKSGNLEETYKVGNSLKVRVLEFNAEDKKIILSEKALVKEEQAAADAQEKAAADAKAAEEQAEVDNFVAKQNDETAGTTLGEIAGLAELAATQTEESTAVVAETTADDIEVIEGIGPAIAKLFIENGLGTYAAIAAASVEEMEAVLAKNSRLKSHDPGTWAQQAQLLADGKLEEFKALTDELKGGKVAE